MGSKFYAGSTYALTDAAVVVVAVVVNNIITTAVEAVVIMGYIFWVRVKHIHKRDKSKQVLEKWSEQNCIFLVCYRVQLKYPVQWHIKITIYFLNSLICCIFF